MWHTSGLATVWHIKSCLLGYLVRPVCRPSGLVGCGGLDASLDPCGEDKQEVCEGFCKLHRLLSFFGGDVRATRP